jgi:hypothetical protein
LKNTIILQKIITNTKLRVGQGLIQFATPWIPPSPANSATTFSPPKPQNVNTSSPPNTKSDNQNSSTETNPTIINTIIGTTVITIIATTVFRFITCYLAKKPSKRTKPAKPAEPSTPTKQAKQANHPTSRIEFVSPAASSFRPQKINIDISTNLIITLLRSGIKNIGGVIVPRQSGFVTLVGKRWRRGGGLNIIGKGSMRGRWGKPASAKPAAARPAAAKPVNPAKPAKPAVIKAP